MTEGLPTDAQIDTLVAEAYGAVALRVWGRTDALNDALGQAGDVRDEVFERLLRQGVPVEPPVTRRQSEMIREVEAWASALVGGVWTAVTSVRGAHSGWALRVFAALDRTDVVQSINCTAALYDELTRMVDTHAMPWGYWGFKNTLHVGSPALSALNNAVNQASVEMGRIRVTGSPSRLKLRISAPPFVDAVPARRYPDGQLSARAIVHGIDEEQPQVTAGKQPPITSF